MRSILCLIALIASLFALAMVPQTSAYTLDSLQLKRDKDASDFVDKVADQLMVDPEKIPEIEEDIRNGVDHLRAEGLPFNLLLQLLNSTLGGPPARMEDGVVD